MSENSYSRCIDFESVRNFRDLGGYRTQGGQIVAWQRLFRSGELRHITRRDIAKLKGEIRLNAVIDLRNSISDFLGVGPLSELRVKYFSVPLDIFPPINSNEYERERALFWGFSNSGEVYSYRIRQPKFGQRVIEALQIIAEQDNLPLVFYCNAGKDRSGILAAIVLSVLGVADEDIIQDYTITAPYMKEFIERWNNDPLTADVNRKLPPYQLEASAESMALFLSTLKREYGSGRGYLEAQGADSSLVHRLENALLA
jgi:protein-tyrosine phosphatase